MAGASRSVVDTGNLLGRSDVDRRQVPATGRTFQRASRAPPARRRVGDRRSAASGRPACTAAPRRSPARALGRRSAVLRPGRWPRRWRTVAATWTSRPTRSTVAGRPRTAPDAALAVRPRPVDSTRHRDLGVGHVGDASTMARTVGVAVPLVEPDRDAEPSHHGRATSDRSQRPAATPPRLAPPAVPPGRERRWRLGLRQARHCVRRSSRRSGQSLPRQDWARSQWPSDRRRGRSP